VCLLAFGARRLELDEDMMRDIERESSALQPSESLATSGVVLQPGQLRLELRDVLSSIAQSSAPAVPAPAAAAAASSASSILSVASSDLVLDQHLTLSGFASVWSGTWQSRSLRVAIKVLHHRMTPAYRAHFERECALLFALRHPNILGIYCTSIDPEGRGMMVSELATNGSLYDYMRAARITGRVISYDQRLQWAIQSVAAFEYLHAHQPQVAHCDIKLENILLFGAELTVKVGAYEEDNERA
jgi:hypothetical protein